MTMKIVGRICMDQSMILLPSIKYCGASCINRSQQQEQITIDEWAEKLQTINYEVHVITLVPGYTNKFIIFYYIQ